MVFLLSFFSSVYNELLRQCQVAINPPIPATVTGNEDSDDVYYRFGSGAIADMLKLASISIAAMCPKTTMSRLKSSQIWCSTITNQKTGFQAINL